MAWVHLISACILEIVWATAMMKSHGFTLLLPSVVTVVTMIGSFLLLALAMRRLPAYTIWTGIGALGGLILSALSCSAIWRTRSASSRPVSSASALSW